MNWSSLSRRFILAVTVWCAIVQALIPAQGGYNLLHHFTGTAGDGGNPSGALLLDGTTLYGMTSIGGESNQGIIFRINTDGSGFTNLHSFLGGSTDGRAPRGSVILAGDSLYGMTYSGGASDFGVVFAMNTNGANFRLLHSFSGGSGDGRYPSGTLLQIGATVFGMTDIGGSASFGYGTVFRVRTNGTSHTILYKFTGGSTDGGWPGKGCWRPAIAFTAGPRSAAAREMEPCSR